MEPHLGILECEHVSRAVRQTVVLRKSRSDNMADPFNRFPSDSGADARIQVEALGEPGRRRFRLLAYVLGETHILWMEKQQVQALGMAIEQMLEQLPESESPIGSVYTAPGQFDESTRHQFRVGRLELGFDMAADRIVISAHDVRDEEDEADPAIAPASVALRITRGEAKHLSEEAAVVVAAGRPRCTMCGSPMEPEGHVCPEQNGHLPFVLDESELE
jgi:uncharacterized repeat protein (TIGR03847 family)